MEEGPTGRAPSVEVRYGTQVAEVLPTSSAESSPLLGAGVVTVTIQKDLGAVHVNEKGPQSFIVMRALGFPFEYASSAAFRGSGMDELLACNSFRRELRIRLEGLIGSAVLDEHCGRRARVPWRLSVAMTTRCAHRRRSQCQTANKLFKVRARTPGPSARDRLPPCAESSMG